MSGTQTVTSPPHEGEPPGTDDDDDDDESPIQYDDSISHIHAGDDIF